MQQPSPSYRESYQAATVSDAARILGVSESTIRRLVRTGKLEAERVERSQGHLWLIRLPSPSTSEPAARQTVSAVEGSNPPAPDAMMAAWSAAVLAPIVAELAASRQVIATQAEQLGQLRERLATTEARLEAAERPQEAPETAEAPPTGQTTPAPDEPVSTPWWRRWIAAAYGW